MGDFGVRKTGNTTLQLVVDNLLLPSDSRQKRKTNLLK